ncbi:uncharacterized protein METZ01_LOCUS509283, partial [marine metagenome]
VIYNITLSAKELKSNHYAYLFKKSRHLIKNRVITVKDKFRDKARDDLSYDLNLIDVTAKMAERGHEKENIENS